MPDFRVVPSLSPTGVIERRAWVDPSSTERASRITPINDRQHRFYRVAVGTKVRLTAILDGESSPQADSVVGLFTTWCIEYPAEKRPIVEVPTPGTSAVVDWTLFVVGHYLLAMRHEDTQNAPLARAGGVVLLHFDVTST